MKTLLKTFYAESLKLKRTLAFWLALIAPLTIVLMQIGMFYDYGTINGPDGTPPWIWYIQMNIVFWGLLVIPLFVTLETALVGNMEHSSDHWKHLNALPVPRGILYAAKQFSGMALIAISSLALIIFMVAGGWLLCLLRPGIGLDAPVPWRQIFLYVGLTYMGAWLVLSLQTWVSIRGKRFVVACATGIALTIAGVFIIHADWGNFWPWALPGAIGNKFSENVVLVPELLFGSIGGVLVALLGGWDVARQDVF